MPKFFQEVRLKFFSTLALLLVALIFFIAPAQLPVVLHKFSLVTLAAVLGYWFDRHLFPYGRPDTLITVDYLGKPTLEGALAVPFTLAMIRRAVVVAAFILGVALAL